MTIIPIPDGYITRPAAEKAYNCSKRTLERHLAKSISLHDVDALSQWLLVTKDGEERPAVNVTTDAVVRDFHATLMHLMGIDHERFAAKFQGLDARLTGVLPSRIIQEVLT